MIRLILSIPLVLFPLAAQAPPIWTVEARPLVVSGGADAGIDAELFNVRGAIRMGSGHLVVANGKPMGIKVFAPDGKYLRTIGRSGGGPGEFEYSVDIRHWGGTPFWR